MSYLWILLAVSLAVSAIGWKYFIYFFSLGYGFGISALALTLVVIFAGAVTPPTALLCAIMFIFGCRLGGYLLYREKKAAAYRKILYDPVLRQKKPGTSSLLITERNSRNSRLNGICSMHRLMPRLC